MKARWKSIVCVLAALLVMVGLCVFALVCNQGSAFEGADGQAEALIAEIAPGYEPWAEPLAEPPGSETESLLFSLQAAIGSGVLCFGFGYLCARKKYRKQEEQPHGDA